MFQSQIIASQHTKRSNSTFLSGFDGEITYMDDYNGNS